MWFRIYYVLPRSCLLPLSANSMSGEDVEMIESKDDEQGPNYARKETIIDNM